MPGKNPSPSDALHCPSGRPHRPPRPNSTGGREGPSTPAPGARTARTTQAKVSHFPKDNSKLPERMFQSPPGLPGGPGLRFVFGAASSPYRGRGLWGLHYPPVTLPPTCWRWRPFPGSQKLGVGRGLGESSGLGVTESSPITQSGPLIIRNLSLSPPVSRAPHSHLFLCPSPRG